MQTPFGVSALNVCLNILVFFLVYVAGLLAALAIRNLLILKLKKEGWAPVTYVSESRLNRVVGFIFSLRQCESPTKFLIVLLSSVLLLIFEISAESGVDSSDFCSPQLEHTTIGLCATPFAGDGLHAKKIAAALYTQQVGWDDDVVGRTTIHEGFRKNFDGREAFEVPTANRALPAVVGGCAVTDMQVVKRLRARLTFQGTSSVWALRLTSVYLEEDGVRLSGEGDVCSNSRFYSAFLVSNATGGDGGRVSATFVDYADSRHIQSVLMAIYRSGDARVPMVARNRVKLVRYTLSCERNVLSPKDFMLAVQIYRSAQTQSAVIEHPAVRVQVGKQNVSMPRPLSAADLVKATVALKATDVQSCSGETYYFTTCGVYNVVMILPVLYVVAVMGVILLFTRWLIRRKRAELPIPTTAKGWYRYTWKEMSHGAGAGDEIMRAESVHADVLGQPEFFIRTTVDNEPVIGLRRRY